MNVFDPIHRDMLENTFDRVANDISGLTPYYRREETKKECLHKEENDLDARICQGEIFTYLFSIFCFVYNKDLSPIEI